MEQVLGLRMNIIFLLPPKSKIWGPRNHSHFKGVKGRNDLYASLLIVPHGWEKGRKLKIRWEVKWAFDLEHRGPFPWGNMAFEWKGLCVFFFVLGWAISPLWEDVGMQLWSLEEERKGSLNVSLCSLWVCGGGHPGEKYNMEPYFRGFAVPSSPSFMYHLGWDNILTSGSWVYINHALTQ